MNELTEYEIRELAKRDRAARFLLLSLYTGISGKRISELLMHRGSRTSDHYWPIVQDQAATAHRDLSARADLVQGRLATMESGLCPVGTSSSCKSPLQPVQVADWPLVDTVMGNLPLSVMPACDRTSPLSRQHEELDRIDALRTHLMALDAQLDTSS